MIEYGITTSQAHYWVHVCPLDRCFYMYSRRGMASRINLYPERKIVSAWGRLVPITPNLRCNGGLIRVYDPGPAFFDVWPFAAADSDREAGMLAELCFMEFVKTGEMLLPSRIVRRYDDLEDQRCGKDFAVDLGAPEIDVEIKYDGPGGRAGTGNLFVQTHEYHHDHAGRNSHLNRPDSDPQIGLGFE